MTLALWFIVGLLLGAVISIVGIFIGLEMK